MRDSRSRDRHYERLQATIRVYRAAVVLCIIIILILSSLLLSRRRRFAQAIRVDGELVCMVANEGVATQVYRQLLAAGKNDLPGKAGFSEQWEVGAWPVEGRPIVSAAEAIKLLGPKLTVEVSAAAITVDGTEVVMMATRELASKALDTLKAKYISEEDKLLAAPKFREEVLIADVQKPADQILTDIGTAVQQLSQTAKGAKTYVVQAHDYPVKIADKHGMSVGELYQLNPGLKGRTLYVGEKLKVAVPAAPITVVTVKETTYTKEIHVEPEKIYSPTLPQGEQRVVREAVPGKKKVFVRCVYENNKMIRETPLRGQIIQEPIPKRVMIGTEEAPAESE